MCGYLSHAPTWGSGGQPRHVPWLGIKPATFWFTGRHSIHWATPARAPFLNSLRRAIILGMKWYWSFWFVPVGIFLLLACSAPSMGYMRQQEKQELSPVSFFGFQGPCLVCFLHSVRLFFFKCIMARVLIIFSKRDREKHLLYILYRYTISREPWVFYNI